MDSLTNKRVNRALDTLIIASSALLIGWTGYIVGHKAGIRCGLDDMRVAIIRKVAEEYQASPISPFGVKPSTIDDAVKYGEVQALQRTHEYLLKTPEKIIEENK